jgi:predicted DNA-binding protein (MmcQ/YjbR family)
VFKVGGRMFALVALDGSLGFVNLKCDPTLAWNCVLSTRRSALVTTEQAS